MTAFDVQYQKILEEILKKGRGEYQERTKHFVKSLPGKTIEIEPKDGFPLLTLRKIPVRIFVAEQIWFLMGSRRPDQFLQKFTKIWDNFTNIDGVVSTAYGYRWQHHFGRDQIDLLVKLLKKEPSSRQGVVVTWDPSSDGLNLKFRKANVPCPYTFTANIIAKKLHFHNIVRSQDMILGCPPDVAGFALLHRILAAKLGVAIGKYTHSISNAHIYDNHYQAAKELIKRKNHHRPIMFLIKPDYYERARKGDEVLAQEIIEKIEKQYQPLPAIKDLKIAI